MAYSDGQTGTPVTVVVPPAQAGVPPKPPVDHHRIPFSGFDLVPVLALAALLLALGSLLAAVRRTVPARAGSPTTR
jgi:hypothetical protein